MCTRIAAATWLLGITVLLATSCLFHVTEERGVTYENQTAFTLQVATDNFILTRLEPGESETFITRKNLLPDRVRAYKEDGTLVFDRTFTWQDLEASDFRVVIR